VLAFGALMLFLTPCGVRIAAMILHVVNLWSSGIPNSVIHNCSHELSQTHHAIGSDADALTKLRTVSRHGVYLNAFLEVDILDNYADNPMQYSQAFISCSSCGTGREMKHVLLGMLYAPVSPGC
jgi:hypothetical protein